MDVVKAIQRTNAGREPERLRLKYAKMREGAFPFLRATCQLFYDQLPDAEVFTAPPATWVCGDLHLENFGSYLGDNGLSYFDINDFDESALAPASWETVRLLTSLWVGAESIGLQPDEAAALGDTFVQTYAATLAAGKAYWVERETAQGLVRELLDSLRDRPRERFLASRTRLDGKRRLLKVDSGKALPAADADRAMVTRFLGEFAATQPDAGFYEVLDVARRIAGTGSLGVPRFVVLARGQGGADGQILLDLKRTLPSSLLPRLKQMAAVTIRQPAWPGESQRVVALQRRMQAVSMAFLHPVAIDGQPWVLRELLPSEDRVVLDRSTQKRSQLAQVLATMARLVAWSQLRSAGRDGSASADALIAYGQRENWQRPLVEASRDCAQQVERDAATFNAAYDAGAFAV